MSKISFKARDLKLSKGAGFKGYIDFKSKNLLFSDKNSDKNLAYDIINQNIKDKDDKYIVIGDMTLFEDVIEVKRSVAGSLYQSNMTMLEITLKGYYDMLDEWVEYKREIASNLINDGESEWIDYGLFKVTQCDYNDEDETTQIVAFDKMIETQKEYKQEDMQLTFPATVKTVFNRVLQVCGLETTTTSFPNEEETISEDVWANAEYTYRDVLSHIAQVTGSIIGVRDNKVEIYQPIETEFKITQNKLNKLQMGDYYGKINILNLTREPQHDNYAYPEDFNTIPQNERKELVFENNPIVDKERERWAPLIFPLVDDLEYREFTADAFVGYGIFEVGDIVTVEEYNTGKEYKCLITEEYTVHRHGLSSEIKSSKPFTSKEQYVVVTDERREGQKTYILVDQLNGQIILATEKIDEVDSKINNTTVKITAKDGVEIKNNNGKGLTVLNDDNEKTVELTTSGNIISRNMQAENIHAVNGYFEGEVVADSGKIGNFTLNNGVLEYTTPEYYRDYTVTDLTYVSSLIRKTIPTTSQDYIIYDINRDGKIDVVDLAMVTSHVKGITKINRIVKTRIRVGTTNGNIVVTTLYKDGNNFVAGESSTISSNEIKTRNLKSSAIYTDTFALAGKLIEIDNNGNLKAVSDVVT